MSWKSGTELYEAIMDALRKTGLSHDKRKKFHIRVVEAFADAGWDCEYECRRVDQAYDEALDELYPDMDWGD